MAIVVVGLAISAPPTSVALNGDHFGALLHPIFPHVHNDVHALAADVLLANLASHEPASNDVAPGLSAPLTEAGARAAAAGIILPFALTMLLTELSRRRQPFEPRLVGQPVSPPTPPPRLLASII